MSFDLNTVLKTMRPIVKEIPVDSDVLFDNYIASDREYQRKLQNAWDYNPAMP